MSHYPGPFKTAWYLTKAMFVAYVWMPIESFAYKHKFRLFWASFVLGNLILAIILLSLRWP